MKTFHNDNILVTQTIVKIPIITQPMVINNFFSITFKKNYSLFLHTYDNFNFIKISIYDLNIYYDNQNSN